MMLIDNAFFRNWHQHAVSSAPETLDCRRMAAVAEELPGALSHLAADG